MDVKSWSFLWGGERAWIRMVSHSPARKLGEWGRFIAIEGFYDALAEFGRGCGGRRGSHCRELRLVVDAQSSRDRRPEHDRNAPKGHEGKRRTHEGYQCIPGAGPR